MIVYLKFTMISSMTNGTGRTGQLNKDFFFLRLKSAADIDWKIMSMKIANCLTPFKKQCRVIGDQTVQDGLFRP